MKKITLFLSVLLMALVVKAQDAEIETYDFKNWPDAEVQLATSSEAVGTAWETGNAKYQSIFPCTTAGLERFAFQGYTNVYNGKGYWLRVGYGLGMVNATRGMAVLNLSRGDLVTFYTSGEIDFTGGGDGDGTWYVEKVEGGHAVTMTSDGNLGLCFTKGIYVTSITIELNAVDLDANVAVTGITLDKNTAEITEGMVMNLLTATVTPVNATDKTITWSSSDETIATVDGGQVTGVAVGTATITATASGFSASCEVTVKAKANLTSWDFAALQASLPNKTGMTYAVNTVKVGGVDCNYGINKYEGLAMQGAGSWFLYTDGGLYNGNSGGRNIGVLNLKKGQIVTVVTNTDTGLTLADATTATQLSVETADGLSTYTYGMKADGTLALNLVRNKVVASINIEESSILVVTDGEDFDAEGTYDAATYTRTVNPEYNYGTICLPFAPDAATCENYTFYTLSACSDVLTFEEETTPEAYVPYLYSAKDKTATTHTFTGGETTIESGPECYTECYTADETAAWMFWGVLAEEFYNVAEMAAISGMSYFAYQPTGGADVLVQATSTITIKPYRGYFNYMSYSLGGWEPLATMRIVVRGQGDNGDGTTAIEEVITPDQIEGAVPATIYNLMGQPVAQPVKGQIYIVNGQKVVY